MQARIHVTEKKLPVADVAARLGVSTLGIYTWIKRYSKPDGSVHVCQDRLKQHRSTSLERDFDDRCERQKVSLIGNAFEVSLLSMSDYTTVRSLSVSIAQDA